MKRFLVGLGLLAAILVPGSSALAAPPNVSVMVECYTEQNGYVLLFHRGPVNEKPREQARAEFELFLAEIDDSCIPGTYQLSFGKGEK